MMGDPWISKKNILSIKNSGIRMSLSHLEERPGARDGGGTPVKVGPGSRWVGGGEGGEKLG